MASAVLGVHKAYKSSNPTEEAFEVNEGHNFVTVTFEADSKAYEALSRLKQASIAGRVTVRSAAVVERGLDGRISVPEGSDAVIGTGIMGGGLIGLLLGVFGGPVGVFFGFGAGALVGSLFDFRRAERESGALDLIADMLPLGGTALVAEVDECAVEVVDGEMYSLGGTVLRIPAVEVLAAVESAEKAADAAEREAARVMHEERKQHAKVKLTEIESEWDQRIDALKKKVGV
jgi:uncharacterized membrane protein